MQAHRRGSFDPLDCARSAIPHSNSDEATIPNTLAHVGLQALLTARLRAEVRLSDLRWVLLGCVIPDVPWILRRVLVALWPMAPDEVVRSYAIAQSSLLVSLVLAAAFVCVARAPGRVGLILGANVFLHLLVDGLQTKWGNGVLWLAPVDWGAWNLGWFWPESLVTYSLSLAGLLIVGLAFRVPAVSALCELRLTPIRLAGSGLCLFVWLGAPWLWQVDVAAANVHGMATMAAPGEAVGQPIEFDRTRVLVDEDGRARIQGVGEQTFACREICPETTGRYSIRGVLSDANTVTALAHHRHISGLRELQSVVGLLCFVAIWGRGARMGAG